MKYPPEWKGRLRVSNGKVFWDEKELGSVSSRYVAGAQSPGGMVTNTVFTAHIGKVNIDFPSLHKAIECVLEERTS